MQLHSGFFRSGYFGNNFKENRAKSRKPAGFNFRRLLLFIVYAEKWQRMKEVLLPDKAPYIRAKEACLMAKAFLEAVQQLPDFLRLNLSRIPPDAAKRTTEIRLRSDRPVLLTAGGTNQFVLQGGNLALQQNASALTLSHEQLKKCFLALCQHSVHSYEREIAQGFFTISGGHRVGVCGTAVVDEEGRIRQIKEPTSLCIRIARVEAQTKDPQLEELMRHAEEGILIAGAPGSGKTTMLRSCSRILSQQGKRIAVVDERRELWPVSEWGFSSAPPQNCDLLSGYPKAEGILHALRSLSPQLMLCDEVGGEKDAQAVAAGANAGVGMVVTVHARDSSELKRRPQTRILLETGAFTRAVFLCGASAPGRIREVAYVDGLS